MSEIDRIFETQQRELDKLQNLDFDAFMAGIKRIDDNTSKEIKDFMDERRGDRKEYKPLQGLAKILFYLRWRLLI